MSAMIPALSVRQPWAWAIAHGHKMIENRTWPTGFRGRLLIHAGLTWDQAGKTDLAKLRIAFPEIPWPAQFELGGIVGEAVMTACVSGTMTDPREIEGVDMRWFSGPFGFVLREARVIPLIAFGGRQGFFGVPEKVLAGYTGPKLTAPFLPDDREDNQQPELFRP